MNKVDTCAVSLLALPIADRLYVSLHFICPRVSPLTRRYAWGQQQELLFPWSVPSQHLGLRRVGTGEAGGKQAKQKEDKMGP